MATTTERLQRLRRWFVAYNDFSLVVALALLYQLLQRKNWSRVINLVIAWRSLQPRVRLLLGDSRRDHPCPSATCTVDASYIKRGFPTDSASFSETYR